MLGKHTIDRSKLSPCGDTQCSLQEGTNVTEGKMEFIKCNHCGILRIPQELLEHDRVLPDPIEKLSPIMRILFNIRMVWLRNVLPQIKNRSVKLLDLGCGDGQFLEFLKGKEYQCLVGLEPDPDRAENARVRKLDIYQTMQDAAAAGKQADNFELIIAWHVLEHVPVPVPFLQDHSALLAPEGAFVISVPNHHSIQTKLFGYYSAYPDYGRHIWYHDKSYKNWMNSQLPGYKVSILKDLNFEYEIFSWVDSIASAITRQQNFIHKQLKKGMGSKGKKILAAALATVLLPVATILSPFSILSGKGSTLTFKIEPED